MRIPLTAFFACLATTALAQDGVRDTDLLFSAADLSDRLSGQVVEFFDDSRAIYRADGTYNYAFEPGDARFPGVWTTHDDSTVCIAFDNGTARCDIYVISGDRLTMVIAEGERFPARSVTPIE